MKKSRKMVRIPNAVNKAISEIAESRRLEPADLTADTLSILTLEQGIMGKPASTQIMEEIELKERVRKLTRPICAGKFDSHFTCRGFRQIRTAPKLLKLYEKEIGDDGFSRGNKTKARINRSLGTIIKMSVGGGARTKNGHCLAARVNDEFILSYTPPRPTPVQSHHGPE